jgi:hypothetical protein
VEDIGLALTEMLPVVSCTLNLNHVMLSCQAG